jgi:hypothetical protein
MSDEKYIPKDPIARKAVELAEQIIADMQAQLKAAEEAETARQRENENRDQTNIKGRSSG